VGNLAPGDKVWVDGPHGAFSPDHHRSAGLVLIAGGVGITPMMSVLRNMAAQGDDREHLLFVGAQSVDELLFRDEIHTIANRIRLKVVELLVDPPEGWTGRTGFLNAEVLVAELPHAREKLDYFLCGAPPMVVGVSAALRSIGVPANRLHTERFDFV
jgi:ferredoxin-NADP reductase